MNGWQWEDPEGFTRRKPTREDIERVARAVADEEGGDGSSTAGTFLPFAVPRFATQDCGTDPRFFGAQRPNHTYGYGRVRTVMPHATPVDLDGNGISNVVLWKDGAWRTFTAPSAPEPAR